MKTYMVEHVEGWGPNTHFGREIASRLKEKGQAVRYPSLAAARAALVIARTEHGGDQPGRSADRGSQPGGWLLRPQQRRRTMATIHRRGNPATLLLTIEDVAAIAATSDPKAALAAMKTQHGLPGHAPAGVAAPHLWGLPLSVEFDRKWTRREGGWYCVKKIGRVYLTRHSRVG